MPLGRKLKRRSIPANVGPCLFVDPAFSRVNRFGRWDGGGGEEMMEGHGYQRLGPQEGKAGELAESWVQVHEQWQEAIYGVEEELLMEEARNIKKEARRRGLTERVNALLRQKGRTFREDSWQRGTHDVESGLQCNQRSHL